MAHEPLMAAHMDHQENYGNGTSENWFDLSPPYSSQHQLPIHQFGRYNAFMQPAPQDMPHEPSLPRMAPPPSNHHGAHHQHQQLVPLMMPSHPSFPLANQAYHQALPNPAPVIPRRNSRTGSHTNASPRKTLSDSDRRRMCQYHEDNPTTKQTEIGAMFGVERSTVSKVLRNKEKYLFSEDRNSPPIKRVKGKHPDIEKALSSWVQKSQSKGLPMTDAIIKDKAHTFASAVGSSESHQKANSSSWLEKFKQKNGIGMGTPIRRASDTSIPDSKGHLRPDSNSSSAQSPTGLSPGSPSGLSQSPLSGTKNEELTTSEEDMGAGSSGNMNSYISFTHCFKNHHSHSAISLSGALTPSASFSGGPTTPTTPVTFSPEDNPFHQHALNSRFPSISHQFQRRQTFPALGIDVPFMSHVEPMTTPQYHHHNSDDNNSNNDSQIQNQNQNQTQSQNSDQNNHPPPLGSPMHELSNQYFNNHIHSTISSPILRHSSSNSSMSMSMATPYSTTPLTTASTSTSPTSSSMPGSPTREDARRALDTLLNYFSSGAPMGLVNQSEYMTVFKLTEKFKLLQGGAEGGWNGGEGGECGRGSRNGSLLGGLASIVEQEGEGLKIEGMDLDEER